jgi:hypothetical protein
MQPFGGDQIYLSSQEVFKVKGVVHEVPEGRLLELHQDVDVAGRLLLTASERAKDADPLYCKVGLNVIGVASEKIDYFHVLSIAKRFSNAKSIAFYVSSSQLRQLSICWTRQNVTLQGT